MPSHFVPSAASGVRGRKAIQTRLAASLAHIFEQSAAHVAFDGKAAESLIGHLTAGRRFDPALFSAYFALVDAIEGGTLDDVQERIVALLRHAAAPQPEGLHVRPLNRDEFTSAEEAEFRQSFLSESLLDEQVAHLTGEDEERSVVQLQRALSILKEHAPASYGEMEILVSEVIPACGRTVNGMQFDGCSSLERWGAMLLNASLGKTDLELAESIVHEAAHIALFALAPVDFHVENDPEELFASPLRQDLRPMNGIYHATFVLARMCFAMREVAASPGAPAPEEARRLSDASAALFAEGYEVVRRNARFTPEGQRIMHDTAAYMLAPV